MSSVSILLAVLAVATCIWFVYRYTLIIPAPQGVPILMYHKVAERHPAADPYKLTVSVPTLRHQFEYMAQKGYTPISFGDLQESISGNARLPEKPVIITFDDGYADTYDLAYPLLREFHFKATIFLPVAYIGGENSWDHEHDRIMDYETIKRISGHLVEFGIHSYNHENFEFKSANEIEADLRKCVEVLQKENCPFVRVFAYPFGRLPRDSKTRKAMKEIFKQNKIDFAVRIGSRINSFPLKDPYELKRTGISSSDTFYEFKIKLDRGRWKLF